MNPLHYTCTGLFFLVLSALFLFLLLLLRPQLTFSLLFVSACLLFRSFFFSFFLVQRVPTRHSPFYPGYRMGWRRRGGIGGLQKMPPLTADKKKNKIKERRFFSLLFLPLFLFKKKKVLGVENVYRPNETPPTEMPHTHHYFCNNSFCTRYFFYFIFLYCFIFSCI